MASALLQQVSSPVPSSYHRLIGVIDIQWGSYRSFARETVEAMFLLRRWSWFNTVAVRQQAHAADTEQYSALVLSAPQLLTSCAQRARDILARSDLPEMSPAPTLTLTPDARVHLQTDCLHRRVLQTCLAQDVTLLHRTVQNCVAECLAPALLVERRWTWISHLCQTVWLSAQTADNRLHRLLHQGGSSAWRCPSSSHPEPQ